MEVHYHAARAAGADDLEIRDAIDIAEMVKETVMMNSRILIDMLTSKSGDKNELVENKTNNNFD
ncbi:MAG: hypothetical protein ACYC38_10565 [Eubacteriales bacterium]